MPYLEFGSDDLTLGIDAAWDRPPAIVRWTGREVDLSTDATPAVEVATLDGGHASPVHLLSRTLAGAGLRYRDHDRTTTGPVHQLIMNLDGPDGLAVRWQLQIRAGVAAVTSLVTVTNTGDTERALSHVTSLSCAVTGATPLGTVTTEDLVLTRGVSEWVGESRWRQQPLRDDVVQLSTAVHTVASKAGLIARAFGTWSTALELPAGVLEALGRDVALAWQIEHNGGWRWQVIEDEARVIVSLSGPTDVDHQWLAALAPGESFTTVPVTVALGRTWQHAIGELTDHRRATRRDHPDNRRQTLIYNDYMNTLLGDPTTEKLLPLVAAAAEAGAEVFCIDAGWYDDGTDWWPSVGAWQPSTTRFPNGLTEVIDAIRDRGLVPGLWLEPEVVGVRSAVADLLPDQAFLLRRGRRVVEAQRYHLDLRHPAARAHLDQTVDRLVGELGVGMFKFDYNVNPGPGTDHDAASAGAGLLGHQRALLDWLDAVLDRYPELIVENCGSGAMRADWAMLSRLNLQSTSDQMDTAAYVPIAAAAAMLMLPEQAGSWAYPSTAMSLEETATTLQNGLLGRLYLSGYLHRLRPEQLALVHQAVRVHRSLRTEILTARPRWPLGLPAWTAPQTALALEGADSTLLTLWHRGGRPTRFEVPLPTGRRELQSVFPTELPGWRTELTGRTLRVDVEVAGPSARTFRLV